jgi:hypothetical protein
MDYPLHTYQKLAERQGFESLEAFERFLLLKRFGYVGTDKLMYELTRNLLKKAQNKDLEDLVEKYKPKYENHLLRGASFYMNYDDRERLGIEVAKIIDDETLVKLLDEIPPEYDITGLGLFRGKNYTYTIGGELELECRWDEVYNETLEVIEKTKGRAYHFLKAIIFLYNVDETRRYGYSYGPSLAEIQTVIRGDEGKPIMLAPQDYVLLKAYRIYYKSGSKRYPGHTVPLEIIPPVEKALNNWENKRE